MGSMVVHLFLPGLYWVLDPSHPAHESWRMRDGHGEFQEGSAISEGFCPR